MLVVRHKPGLAVREVRASAALRRGLTAVVAAGLMTGLAGVLVGPGASAAPAPTVEGDLAAAALAGSSNAVAGPSVTGQVFWAYVEPGGSLDIGGEFRNLVGGGSATDLTVRATSPSGVVFTRTIPISATDPLPALSVLGLHDNQAGVWRIMFDDGVSSTDPDGGLARWGITPRDLAGTAQKGRVFVEQYAQSVQATRPVDPAQTWDQSWDESLYFLNSDGVAYRVQGTDEEPDGDVYYDVEMAGKRSDATDAWTLGDVSG